MLVNDWLAVAISTLLSVAHIGACRLARKRALLSAAVSRKLIHIGTGVLYVGSWSLFSDDQQSKYVCGLVPTIITTRFLALGLGVFHDSDTVRSVSVSGRRDELLAGPFEYGCVFIVLTMLAWRRPVALLATAVLCCGDGAASLVDQSPWPRGLRLPHNRNHSLLSSLAFFTASALAGVAALRAARASHWFAPGFVPRYEDDVALAFGAALVSALVYFLPLKSVTVHNNVLVPLAACIWYWLTA